MVSSRRTRALILTVLAAALVCIYLVTGSSSTERSAFYRKTVHFTEQRLRAADAAQQPPDSGPPLDDARMRQGLKDAESQAKGNADRKFREFEGSNEQIVGVAGRKMMAAAHDDDAAAAPAMVDIRHVYDELVAHGPITIFSKSYCPHSRRAKHILLDAFEIAPKPFVVELDLHERGAELQDLLKETTGRRTVPNVIVEGKSLGGGDDMDSLWRSGDLSARFKDAAGGLLTRVKQVIKYGDELK